MIRLIVGALSFCGLLLLANELVGSVWVTPFGLAVAVLGAFVALLADGR